jgi:hypothetical protein
MKRTQRTSVTPMGHLVDAFQAMADRSTSDELAHSTGLLGYRRLKPRGSSQRCKERLVQPSKFSHKLASKPLGVEQEHAIDGLLTGKSDRETAEAMGVRRLTVQQ